MPTQLLPDSQQSTSREQRQAVPTVSCVTGKAMVYTAAAGVFPHQVMPIQLDVGCNTPEVREQPLYMGLQQVGPPASASKPTITNFSTVLALWPATVMTNLQAYGCLMQTYLQLCMDCHRACTTSSVADHSSVSNTDTMPLCSAVPSAWSHYSSQSCRPDSHGAKCYPDRTIAWSAPG